MSHTSRSENATTWRQRRGAAGRWLAERLGVPGVAEYTRRAVEAAGCQTGLDLGCGVSSHLTALRPKLKTFGVDADAGSIAESQSLDVHDGYAVADIVAQPLDELREWLYAATGHDRFDVVTAYGVIEHLTKRDGWMLLEKCEALANKLVILETPNGFVPQGPEFGNRLQRHLSGWFPSDFRGVGYQVIGTCGTRYLRGYMGQPRIAMPGTLLFDQIVLGRVLRSGRNPQHAFNLAAIKDVRGVPARYSSREDFRLGRRAA
jgi:hypothetical protein